MPDIIKQGFKLVLAVVIVACGWWVIRYLFSALGVQTHILLGIAFFALLFGILSYGFRVE